MADWIWIAWVVAAVSVGVNIAQFVLSRRQGVVVRAETGPNVLVAHPGRRTAAVPTAARRRVEGPAVTEVRVSVAASSTIIIEDAAVCTSPVWALRRRGSLAEQLHKPEGVAGDGKPKTIVLRVNGRSPADAAPMLVRVRTERGHHYYARVKRLPRRK